MKSPGSLPKDDEIRGVIPMEVLQYRDYTGSVDFLEDEKVYRGALEGVEEPLRYEGKDVSELMKAFREAVDRHILAYGAKGKKPPLRHIEYSGIKKAEASPEDISLISIYYRNLSPLISWAIPAEQNTPHHCPDCGGGDLAHKEDRAGRIWIEKSSIHAVAR